MPALREARAGVFCPRCGIGLSPTQSPPPVPAKKDAWRTLEYASPRPPQTPPPRVKSKTSKWVVIGLTVFGGRALYRAIDSSPSTSNAPVKFTPRSYVPPPTAPPVYPPPYRDPSKPYVPNSPNAYDPNRAAQSTRSSPFEVDSQGRVVRTNRNQPPNSPSRPR